MADDKEIGAGEDSGVKGMVTKNINPLLDHTSPYFLSPSDNPGQIFVGELLGEGNYSDWSNDMTNMLLAKNKIGFVDGTIEMPKSDSPDLPQWKRCNAMVKGWLTSAMEKDIRNSVKYAVTAQEIWLDLEERFGKESAPRAYELKRAVASIRQEKLSISAYYTKLRGLWDEIQSIIPLPTCTCGGCKCNLAKKFSATRERERLYEFLMGLNEEYTTIKTQILSTRPSPSLGAAFHLVSEDEQQRIISATRRPIQEMTAFQVTGRRDHQISDAMSSQMRRGDTGQGDRRGEKKDGRRCTHCGKLNHTVEKCFEVIGYPEWWEEKYKDKKQRHPRAASVQTEASPIPGLTMEQYSRLVKLVGEDNNQAPVANMSGKLNFNTPWIIDSGATDHDHL